MGRWPMEAKVSRAGVEDRRRRSAAKAPKGFEAREARPRPERSDGLPACEALRGDQGRAAGEACRLPELRNKTRRDPDVGRRKPPACGAVKGDRAEPKAERKGSRNAAGRQGVDFVLGLRKPPAPGGQKTTAYLKYCRNANHYRERFSFLDIPFISEPVTHLIGRINFFIFARIVNVRNL